MAVVTVVPDANIWKELCKEVPESHHLFTEDDNLSVATVLEDYDPAKHSPVFFGDVMYKRVEVDQQTDEVFDASLSHPACVGFAFVSRPEISPVETPQPPPYKDKCSPREYLEHYVFPILLPALEELLKQAKYEKCFEKKRTKFNAADFLTEYLYRNNPLYNDRQLITLSQIPFVQDWWKDHPRPPLPNSLLWSEEEASLIIQTFWQGYKVRAELGVQELRQWQREWRLESKTEMDPQETLLNSNTISDGLISQ